MRSRVHLMGGESGFGLIELLVAITILVVGLLGTFALVESANGQNARARAREGATNMAREVLEDARVMAFRSVDTTSVAALLPSLPGYTSMASATSARISRRGITYTVGVSVCSLDDAQDGLGAHPLTTTWCSDNPAAGTADGQPEDYKRITASVTFPQQAGTVTVHQVSTVNSAGAAVGTPVLTLSLTGPAVADPNAPVIGPNNNTATFVATTAAAVQNMIFSIDGTDQPAAQVTSNAAKTQWTFTWPISTLSDGDYDVAARTVDQLGVQGQRRSMTVTLDEGKMSAPKNVVAGWNTVWETGASASDSAVELTWDTNSERNVVGYQVTGPNGVVNCPSAVLPADPTQTYCVDTNAPAASPSVTYSVAALYTDPLSAATTPTVGPETPVTITQSGASSYGLAATQANTGTANCSSLTASMKHDLQPNYPGSGTATSIIPGAGGYATWCTAPGPASFGAGSGSLTITIDNKTKSGANFNCYVGYYLVVNANGTSPLLAVLPSNTTKAFYAGAGKIVTVTKTFTLPAQTFSPTDQLGVALAMGNGCDYAKIMFGGANTGQLNLPNGLGWASPSPPTGLSVTAQADGSRVLSWTAPPPPSSGTPAVAFYRIYRDGKTYDSRIDTTGSTGGAPDTTYTDTGTGGTSHTYYVTATSYCFPASPSLSCAPGLAESSFLGPVTG